MRQEYLRRQKQIKKAVEVARRSKALTQKRGKWGGSPSSAAKAQVQAQPQPPAVATHTPGLPANSNFNLGDTATSNAAAVESGAVDEKIDLDRSTLDGLNGWTVEEVSKQTSEEGPLDSPLTTTQ